MNTRVPSLLTRVISAAAERLADHPTIPLENRLAFRQAAEHVMHAQWASMVGGETVVLRIYASRMSPQTRDARRARILGALAAHEAPAAIAKREGVSARWVRKLQAQQQGGTVEHG